MDQYNIFQAIFMSFYSKRLYRDVAMNWGAKAFGYLLLILALSWILLSFQIQMVLNQMYKHTSDKLLEQIPILTIKDGKVSTPEDRPYIIDDREHNQRIAVIDTTGKFKTIEDAKATLLLTQTQLISQPKDGETKINEIPSTMNMVIDPKVINSYVAKYLGFAWILIFVCFTIVSYIYRVVQALIYALIGLIFNASSSAHLSYGQILKIALVAITPVIILSTLLDFFLIQFPFQGLFYFVLAMIYLCYGIVANKKDTSV